MRWTKKIPISGEIRTVKRFLLYPTTIGSETRWLEFATIKQKYCMPSNVSYLGPWWQNMTWVNE